MKAHVKPYLPSPGEHERFLAQVTTFDFRWRCPDCIHVAPASGKCSLEFRTQDLMAATSFVEDRGNFTFCKYFEAA